MAISTIVTALIVEQNDEDRVNLQVSLQLAGVPHSSFGAEIDTHAYERPVVIAFADALGVDTADRDTLALGSQAFSPAFRTMSCRHGGRDERATPRADRRAVEKVKASCPARRATPAARRRTTACSSTRSCSC